MMMLNFGGYWISPKGRAYKVKGDHYRDIVAFPARFGLKSSQVKNKEFVEIFGLANRLIHQGWVRMRNYGFPEWSFQVSSVEDQVGIVAEILSKAEAGPQEHVLISEVDPAKPSYAGDVEDVYTGAILRYPQQ